MGFLFVFLVVLIPVKLVSSHAYRKFANGHYYVLQELNVTNEIWGPQDFRFHWYIMRGRFKELHRAEDFKRYLRVLQVIYIVWYAMVLLFVGGLVFYLVQRHRSA